ncbi:MAG: hypothetical protein QOF21_2174 [Actinomycetota bacterium]
MILVASSNGDVGMDAGWTVLDGGGSALDAVEAATREVERNAADHTVGLGGYPNLVGEVELDASIMDGVTRHAGCVGALRGYVHAITVARAVLERLPHVLVVGDGAARLAAEIGLETEETLTDEARDVWQRGLDGTLPDGPGTRMLSAVAALAADPDHAAGTVNFLAIDGAGGMASAVSTSGWAWKYPGRLGDSPIIGAGNYCDVRHGAAACTGFGELAIRSGTAGRIVAGLARGESLNGACAAAIADLYELGVAPERMIMHAVALDAAGRHHGVTTDVDGSASYLVRQDGMAAFERLPRIVVNPG